MKNSINQLEQRIRALEQNVSVGVPSAGTCSYSHSLRKLQETVEDLQCRSMKNNLIFTNLAEQPDEDVESKLRAFLCD